MYQKKVLFKQEKEIRKYREYRKLFLMTILFFCTSWLCFKPVLATVEECSDDVSAISSAICVPAVALEDEIDPTDGRDTGDWVPGNYYEFVDSTATAYDPAVYVSYKKKAFGEVDLYLLFKFSADPLNSIDDEIRIGLNPGTSPDENTLVKIFPWKPSGITSYTVELYNYNSGTNNWTDISGSWPAGAVIGTYFSAITHEWSVEVKIPLNDIPNHPIIGTDFRLYLEIGSEVPDFGIIYFPWPAHYLFDVIHNHICSDPEKWYLMSFGTDCHPDLRMPNGLYSCDSIYIWRDGAKSKEIYVSENNEFHADVENPGSQDATGVQVYMTLLQLGTSTAPIAMNYSHTDTNITNWFEQQFGTWLLATEELDTGSPRPPTPFNVNMGTTNTDPRFTWNPSDEDSVKFGDPADMVGSHKCTAAFIDFKDDPNMQNNFSYCNTDIVEAPSGLRRSLHFWVGQYFAYAHPQGKFNQWLKINVLNEPYNGWFKRSKFKVVGDGVNVIGHGRDLFEVPVPPHGNNALVFEFTAPYKERHEEDDNNIFVGEGSGNERRISGLKSSSVSNLMKDRDARVKEIFGNRPIILIEAYVPAGYKTGAGGERKQLFRLTSYAAFALDLRETYPPPRLFELTLPFAGWTYFNNNLGLKNGPVVGVKLGYRFVNLVTLEAEAGFGFTEDTVLRDKGNWIQLMANLRFRLPFPGPPWSMDVTGGAGVFMFRGFADNDEAFALQGGWGLTYKFSSSFGLRFDARALRLGPVFTAPATTNFQATGGLVFWF